MKRRTLILGGGAAALTGGLWWLRADGVSLANIGARPRLAYPPLIDSRSDKSFSLLAQSGETEFFKGRPTPTLGFNQSYLGPVIRLERGEVAATVSNSLQRNISCHWHGLLLPGQLDGGPHQPIENGKDWRPVLTIDQDPCTAWYHTHIHGETASGVYSGLAGGIIVSDGRDDERGLPATYAHDDLFLVIQDKEFTADGHLAYSQSMPTIMHGFSGSTIVVNGQIGAAAQPPKSIVRCRLLNACNARILNLAFQSGREMHLVATDNGYIAKPVALNSMRVAPGERAEILVDFSDGHPDALVSDRDMNAGMGGMMGRFQQMGASILGNRFEVLAFRPMTKAGRITQLPDQLTSNLPDPHSVDAVQVRQFSLDMGMGFGMMGGGGRGDIMAINSQPYNMGRLDFAVRQGTWERWKVSAHMLAHPFHIHGTSFLVVSENGRAPSAPNRGWKDTVLVNQEVELLAKFEHAAPRSTPFMYHCHILEHEDAGMMGQFAVI